MSKSKRQKKQEKLTTAVAELFDGHDFEMVCNAISPIISSMIENVPPQIGITLTMGLLKQILSEAYGSCVEEIHAHDGPLQ